MQPKTERALQRELAHLRTQRTFSIVSAVAWGIVFVVILGSIFGFIAGA